MDYKLSLDEHSELSTIALVTLSVESLSDTRCHLLYRLRFEDGKDWDDIQEIPGDLSLLKEDDRFSDDVKKVLDVLIRSKFSNG